MADHAEENVWEFLGMTINALGVIVALYLMGIPGKIVSQAMPPRLNTF